MIKYLAFTVAALCCSTTFAQQCKLDSIASSHKPGQYLDNKDGTVTDIVNGLMWQKCSLGQAVVNGECEQSPTSFNTWKDALQGSEDNKSFAGNDDYRLPNIKELASLVERACIDPAINLAVFPSTPSIIYWSNTSDHKLNISQEEIRDLNNGVVYGAINEIPITGRLIDFVDGTEFLTDVNRFVDFEEEIAKDKEIIRRTIRLVRKIQN
jgi:hypothetical protein